MQKLFILINICLFFVFSSASLAQDCKDTPFWKLNLCQIDCSKCGANNACQICPTGFNLTSNKCEDNKDLIYHSKYFSSSEMTSISVNEKSFRISNQYLAINDIVRTCKAGSYKFDMLGLFKQQDRLSFTFQFSTSVTQVTFKFYFLTIFKNTRLELIFNGEQVYDNTFNGATIKSTYEPAEDAVNYLSIPSLTQSSAGSLIRKIDSGQIKVDQNKYKVDHILQFQITFRDNTTNSSNFWAVSDFSVVGKKCEECLPQRLKTLSKNIGIAIGINAGALVLLILILFGCVKWEQKRRRTYVKEQSKKQNLSGDFDREQTKEDNAFTLRQTIQKTKDISPSKNKNT